MFLSKQAVKSDVVEINWEVGQERLTEELPDFLDSE
jgi:hypothetical protein